MYYIMPRRRNTVKALFALATVTTVFIVATFYADTFNFHGPMSEEELLDLESEGYRPYHNPNLRDIRVPVVKDEWQDVPLSIAMFFVYSAFFERRGAFQLRVVGTTSRVYKESAWCVLWYGDAPTIIVKARIQIIREHHNMPYSACFVFCPLEDTFPIPESVSIVGDPRAVPTNRLPVVDNNPAVLEAPRQLAACIKPLYNYTNVLELIEFCEMYKLLGVDNVVVYYHTVSPQVSCVLDTYAGTGNVTPRPWQLDLVSDEEIRTQGIFAALNDCLYRYMYRYSNVIVVDLDEFILPQTYGSLVQLVDHLDTKNDATKSVGAYIFKNAFFYLDWPQAPDTVDTSDPWLTALYTTGKLRRKLQLENYYYRSKYIFKPERVVEVGNHFVWEYMPGVRNVRVPPALGVSQHYRTCDEDDCSKRKWKVDRTALKFKDKLLRNVKDKWEAMRERCKFPNITEIAQERWVHR